MKVACLGGGPAGLYFAICMKLHDPAHEVARSIATTLGLRRAPVVLRRRLVPWEQDRRISPTERRRLAASAFRLRGQIDGRAVLLVDDVMTTGATVTACSRLLRAAGAAEVRVAVWARALPDPGGIRPPTED